MKRVNAFFMHLKARRSASALPGRQLTILTRQLGDLLSAGVPLLQTLDVLIGDSGPGDSASAFGPSAAPHYPQAYPHAHPSLSRPMYAARRSPSASSVLLQEIRMRLIRGDTLSMALRAFPHIFDSRYRQFITVGEASGTLAKMLRRIAEERATQAHHRRQIQQALLYPACVCGMALIVVVALMVWAVPAFKTLFDSFGAPLPALTQTILAFCAGLARWAPPLALAGLAAIAGVVIGMRHRPALRSAVHARWLAVPIVGRLSADHAMSRWTGSVSALLAAGVPLLEALRTMTQDVAHPVLHTMALRLILRLERGETLSGAVIAMMQYPTTAEGRTAGLLFSRSFVTIIQVAEQTGALDTMLGEWSIQLGRDTHWRITEWMRALEPAVMVLCGAWVAVLVLSLYLPIIELGNVV